MVDSQRPSYTLVYKANLIFQRTKIPEAFISLNSLHLLLTYGFSQTSLGSKWRSHRVNIMNRVRRDYMAIKPASMHVQTTDWNTQSFRAPWLHISVSDLEWILSKHGAYEYIWVCLIPQDLLLYKQKWVSFENCSLIMSLGKHILSLGVGTSNLILLF